MLQNFAEVSSLHALAPADLSESLLSVERHSRRVEAIRHIHHVMIAGELPQDFVSQDGYTRVRDVGIDEVAAQMKWTPDWTRRQVGISRILINRLPETIVRLFLGEISAYHAALIAEGLKEIFSKTHINPHALNDGGELAKQYEDKVLPRSSEQSITELRRSIRKTVIELAPIEAEEAHELALQNRRLEVVSANDGMCWLNAYLPAVDAHRIFQKATTFSRDKAKFAGTESQNQLDAFVQLFLTDEVTGQVDTEIQVTVSLETLLGLSDSPAVINGTSDTVTANAVRDLAAHSRLRRLVLHPISGQILDYGRETYRAPAPLRDFVVNRDQVCRYPGCTRVAERNDLDHSMPWEKGGTTSQDNLVSLCRRHHNLKTHAGWKYALNEDGSVTWTSPSGQHMTDPPRQRTA